MLECEGMHNMLHRQRLLRLTSISTNIHRIHASMKKYVLYLEVHRIGLDALLQSLNQIYCDRWKDSVLLTVYNCAFRTALSNEVLDGEAWLDACPLGLAPYLIEEQNWANCTRT